MRKVIKDFQAETDGILVLKPSVVDEYYMSLERASETKICLPTDFPELNKVLYGGLQPGVYVFGGNPGSGKTSFCLHLLETLALRKQHSIFFNLEMHQNQIVSKLLSGLSYRMNKKDKEFKKLTINDLYDMTMENMTDQQRKLLVTYRQRIEPYINIISLDRGTWQDSNPCNYVRSVGTALRNYKKIHDITPVVVIDFLQLLKDVAPTVEEDEPQIVYDKRLEMNEIIKTLKHYSNIHNAVIIVISSLSRSSYTSSNGDVENSKVSMSCFKETGEIEYRADFCRSRALGSAPFMTL